MTFALFGIISIIVCWKWGNWRNWREYYPTILFLLIGDLVADLVLFAKPLWGFNEFIEKYTVLDIAVMLLIYPSTVILFLSFYPTPRMKQVLYILVWIGIYSILEGIGLLFNDYSHHNNWSIWYSILFNTIMFPLIRLHYKKPLWVWPISAVFCFMLLWWFRIPLQNK